MKVIIFIILIIFYFLPFVWVQGMIFKIKRTWKKTGEDYPILIKTFNEMSLIPIMNILLIGGLYKGLDIFNKKI
ncbi:hypothetical protein [uncultured Clostridium sp.]|uniref:hypothetical protein n=1 Tax=uncultured Clostridium sp. TaxID=59620 RepID=UPI0026018FE4|nr:hypothetical protein [uncultured Clostridium sp.]